MVFGRRYDSNLEAGGYNSKLTPRSDGIGYYETRTDAWERLGTTHKTKQRYTYSPNSDGVYEVRRVGLHAQDLHKGTDAGNVPRRTDPVQEHYRKLGNYYKNKYGA